MLKAEQLKKAKKVFTDRGFEPRDYSIENLVGDYLLPKLPHVIAIGTSGGKTWTGAAKFEFLYKYQILKKDEKVLILAADKSILRSNFVESFSEFFQKVPASFTWRAVRTKKELEKAIEDDIQVIITLPQTIQRPNNLKLLSKVNIKWFLQDEAHKWYFKKTIQRILKTLKPKYQTLLTGTPFKFNMENMKGTKDKFMIHYTSVREMYEMGYLSDFTAQVLHSDIQLNKIDYVSALGNLKSTKSFTENETISILDGVITQIIKKLKLPLKGLSTTHNVTKNYLSAFGKLQKSILFTHGIAEANYVYSHLKKMGIGVLVTHSKAGTNSVDVFDEFKKNNDVKVLVAVNQGKEGFDFPSLYNVIDMTYSQNFEVVMQIIGRVLRKNEDIPMKYFFKVAPKNTAGYFVDWMNALFMLFDKEWYSKFNGKNGFDIQIPNSLLGKSKSQTTSSGNSSSTKSKGNIKPRNLEFFNSLDFMKKNKWFKIDDKLSTVATSTLRDVAKMHGIHSNFENWTSEKIQNIANNYTSFIKFRKENRTKAYAVAHRMGILDDVTSHMTDKKTKWTVDKAMSMSKKIKYIDELLKNRALDRALRDLGIREDAIAHMRYRNGKRWTTEEIIKEIKDNNLTTSAEVLKYNKNLWSAAKNKKILEDLVSVRPRRRQVNAYEFNTNKFIKTYNSVKEASDNLGIAGTTISKVCRKKASHSHGYYFEYVN